MEQPHSLCRARKASGADAAGNFNGWSPCALCHGAVCSPQSPSPCRPSPAPWRTAGRGAARRRRQREEWSLRMAPCSQPHSAGRIAAADLHRLPFQEGLHCPGLADLIPCLRGLVKEKEGRKKKKKNRRKPLGPPRNTSPQPSPRAQLPLHLCWKEVWESWGPRLGQESWDRLNPELPGGGRTCAHQRERARQFNRNRHKSRCNPCRKPSERGSCSSTIKARMPEPRWKKS